MFENRITPYQIAYWLKKGFTENEAIEQIKEYKSNKATTLKNFKKKHGEVEGQRKFDEWVGKCKNTKEKFLEKFGGEGEKKWEEYLKTKDSSSLNWAVKKMGSFKAGKKLFDDKNNKTRVNLNYFLNKFKDKNVAQNEYEKCCKKKNNSSLDYFLQKFEDKEVAFQKYKEILSKKDVSSFGYFLRKTNDFEQATFLYNQSCKRKENGSLYYYFKKCDRNLEEAKKLYKNDCIKRGKNFKQEYKVFKASKASLKYFLPLYKQLRKLGIERNDIFFGVKGSKEYFFYNNDIKRFFFYDFTIKSKKIVIEFNGGAFHPNINKFSEAELIENFKPVFKDKTVQEIIDLEKIKHKTVLSANFKLLILWEEDGFENNKNKLNNFIKDNIYEN